MKYKRRLCLCRCNIFLQDFKINVTIYLTMSDLHLPLDFSSVQHSLMFPSRSQTVTCGSAPNRHVPLELIPTEAIWAKAPVCCPAWHGGCRGSSLQVKLPLSQHGSCDLCEDCTSGGRGQGLSSLWCRRNTRTACCLPCLGGVLMLLAEAREPGGSQAVQTVCVPWRVLHSIFYF